MARDPVDVDTQTAALARRLDELAARVLVLERQASAHGLAAPVLPTTTPATEIQARLAADAPSVSSGLLPLAGRTLVVLGGALLFRALTDENILPAWGGIAAGLAYAAFWLRRADADALRPEARVGAVLHGLTALGIGYPLILETTLRFHLLSPSQAGLLITACFAGGLLVSERRDLPTLAWANAMLAAGSALVVQVGTRDLLPLTAGLLAIGVLIESRDRRAAGPRAIVAIAANLAVAVCVIVASRREGLPEGYAPLPLASVVFFALLLPTLYVGRAALRTLREAEPLDALLMLQAPMALLVGLGGAARVLSVHEAPSWPIGAAAALLALGCYLAAFAVVDRRSHHAATFYAYTTLAFLLATVGLGTVLAREGLAVVLGALGLLVLMLANLYKRQTLRFHGVAYLAASAAAGGLLPVAWNGLVTDPRAAWHPITGLTFWALLMLALGYALLLRRDPEPAASVTALLPPMLAAATLLTCASGLVAIGLARVVALAPSPGADLAEVGAVRTVVMAAAAIGIAWAGVRFARRELVPLAYAALAAGALSVLVQNLPVGRPATLFAALAAYGSALVATPRLLGGRLAGTPPANDPGGGPPQGA